MKLKGKIIADRYFGNVLVFLLAFFSRLTRKKKNPEVTFPVRKIIVSKYYGMGSIIQSTPLLCCLKENFPGSEIIFLTTAGNRDLISHIPFVDKCFVLNDTGFFSLVISFAKTLLKIRKYSADVFIDLETFSNFSVVIAALSKAKFKSGTSFNNSKSRADIFNSLIDFKNKTTVAENYLLLAISLIENSKMVSSLLYYFPSDDISHQSVHKKLTVFPSLNTNNVIIINANASDLCVERRWPLNNFALLVELLAHKLPGSSFLFTGSGKEFDYIEKIKKTVALKYQSQVFNVCGLFSFSEFNALLNLSRLVVTNDTGPMHLALAKNIKLVALFGPNTPYRYAKNSNSVFIYNPVPCSPCIHLKISPPCNGNNICMKNISVQTVFNACINLLQDNLPEENLANDKILVSS